MGGEKLVVGYVADIQLDGLAGVLVPGAQPVWKGKDGGERLDAELIVPLPPGETVDDGHRMSFFGQIKRRCPTAVAVAAQYGNLHVASRKY